jgi:outer membrane receptor protein involved in Fe transport
MLFQPALLRASVFGEVQGVVRDSQHRAVPGARVELKARSSAFEETRTSGADGSYAFRAVPFGEYTLTASLAGFKAVERALTVASFGTRAQEIELPVADLTQSVEVSAVPEAIGTDSPTPTVLVGRDEIAATPGADRANSLASITTYVPGSWMTHDQLHVRGGHQVSWLIDGVPVPNTNIASNVGPQFSPGDIDYLEVQRGGYSAEYGDRTYAVFNVVPRTGFERSKEAEVAGSYGSFSQTNDTVSLGDHTDHLAYYASLGFNRSDHGLSPPTAAILHDGSEGYGAFASVIDEIGPNDELRMVVNSRKDRYDIPNDPTSLAQMADVERESDTFVNVSFVHTLSPDALLTVSPFFHYNESLYEGGAQDTPLIPDEGRESRYLGAQAALSWTKGAHEMNGGAYLFSQWDSASFSVTPTDGSAESLHHQEAPTGNLEAVFLEDTFHATKRLTATAGVRLTHFEGSLSENAASPRGGLTFRVPGLEWTLRASYGRYYQAPPLSTVSGPLLQFALQQGFGFLPLRGERDEEHAFGVTVPIREWTLDVNTFRTGVRNFFDHDAINNSNIFLPLTIDRARIQAVEVVVRSPRSFTAGEASLAYSLQHAEGQGAVTGGLTDFSPPDGSAYYPLDHDQRHTLSLALRARVLRRGSLSAVFRYGSGFTDGSALPPAHLPAHATGDASFSYRVSERLTLALNALNLTNASYLVDNSLTFGGTHWSDPREVYAEVRYRFHY